MGNISLVGPDSDIWTEEDPDHVTLWLPKSRDPLFRSLSDGWLQRFHLLSRWFSTVSFQFANWEYNLMVVSQQDTIKAPTNTPGVVMYSDDKIATFTRTISTFVACLLPVISIVILYFVDGLPKRIGVLAGLTAAFCICLLRFTTSDAGNIFATTAA